MARSRSDETEAVDVSPGNRDTVNAYSRLSDADYDALGPDGDFGRRALLNPAIFRLLGDVRRLAILDAGCGHGYLSRLLAERGATVTGLEPADVPYRYATTQERARRQGITYLQRDLSVPGDIGGPFDAVVANMVLLDIPMRERIHPTGLHDRRDRRTKASTRSDRRPATGDPHPDPQLHRHRRSTYTGSVSGTAL